MDDIFDNERLQKMKALGIFDDDKLAQLNRVTAKTGPSNKTVPAPDRPSPTSRPPPETPPPLGVPLGRPGCRAPMDSPMRGGPRGRPFRGGRGGGGRGGGGRGGGEGHWRGFGGGDHFKPLPNSAVKWQEFDLNRDRDRSDRDEWMAKRQRNSLESTQMDDRFRKPFMDGMRDTIQTKIERNELERKLNIDYMNDRSSGNSADTDLRPAAESGSGIGDTDLRPNAIRRKPTDNSSNVTFAAKDDDLRPQGQPRPGCSRPPVPPKKASMIDDIDDFIKNAEMKLDMGLSSDRSRGPRGQTSQRGRGRGGPQAGHHMSSAPQPRHHMQSAPQPRHHMQSAPQPSAHIPHRSDDPLGLRQPEPIASQPDEEPDIIEVAAEAAPNRSKHVAILRETVEELAKSNLYCQYCDCYLASLAEVNTHIGTGAHQQNMTKHVMEEHKQSAADEEVTQQKSRVVEKVPIGMAIIVRMIEQNQKITLNALTDMTSYEIRSDSEAALAKELAKLLTNELLNYKMNLMPEQVKQALKNQGIGLLDSVIGK